MKANTLLGFVVTTAKNKLLKSHCSQGHSTDLHKSRTSNTSLTEVILYISKNFWLAPSYQRWTFLWDEVKHVKRTRCVFQHWLHFTAQRIFQTASKVSWNGIFYNTFRKAACEIFPGKLFPEVYCSHIWSEKNLVMGFSEIFTSCSSIKDSFSFTATPREPKLTIAPHKIITQSCLYPSVN